MESLTLDAFKNVIADYDAAVAKTPGITQFCSSSHWILAAHEALHQPREPLIFYEKGSWCVLAAGPLFEFNCVVQPFDALWSFSCPIVGADEEQNLKLFEKVLCFLSERYPLFYIGGIPEGSPLFAAIANHHSKQYHLYSIPACHCLWASLEGGSDGFLKRRNSKFRHNLKHAIKKADAAGITFELVEAIEDSELLFQRILAVDKTTWKWAEGESIFQSDAYPFYEYMFASPETVNCMRVVFARKSEEAVGYAFGAIFSNAFRGLQMGYQDDLKPFAIGNLCQWELIKFCSSQQLDGYDLGMEIEYKARWSDSKLRLSNLLLLQKDL